MTESCVQKTHLTLFKLFLFVFIPGLLLTGSLHCDGDISKNERDTGVVVAVYDGDTLKVEFAGGRIRNVRLIGIDAPETDHPREKVKLMAQLSKRFAFYFLYRKKIRLTYDWQREDQYGRLLAYVWTDGGELFNEFMLIEGFASAYLKFPFKNAYRSRFSKAEKQARSLNKGLWRQEPYPKVMSSEAGRHVGQTAAVEFTCHRVQSRGKFVYLHTLDGKFAALIPLDNINLFSNLESLEGRILSVKGFVEEYRGQPQILVFFPSQINQD